VFALLQGTVSDLPLWLQKTEAWATIFQGFGTPLLILVGGIFAWYKFIRQGEHDPRLKPSVTATATIHDGVIYVFATATVQNNGKVDVVLTDEGSALTTFTTSAEGQDWLPLYAPEHVFRGHKRVRPSETLEDQKLIQVEYADEVAVRLDLAVSGQDATENINTWDTMAIVSLLPD
jgi:hypothetical protein